nr:MAG TPA: Replication initiator A family protein [Caudoviricetes sp.]
MNYMTEIKMFNEWLETNELSTSGIALWYALMYMANRSGWKQQLYIPVSVIMLRTKMSRSTIYREREVLRDYGLIDFEGGDGRQSSSYRIIGFEERFASHVVFHTETQDGTQPGEVSRVASHTETQTVTQDDFVFHTGTQSGTIYKHKQNLSLDKEKDINGGSGEKKKTAKSPKKEKAAFDLSFIGDPAWENLVSTWLDYKQSRGESYKSELSVKKFHTMLRNLSRGDPAVAARIIDKSIANNWAGIFELTDKGGKAAGQPASGQRIGQIKQPGDEERRQKLLDKFGRGACPERNGGNDSGKNINTPETKK